MPQVSGFRDLGRAEAINAKVRQGIAQLDLGEEIPEVQADEYLKELKAKPE
jgi:hypothetical protein